MLEVFDTPPTLLRERAEKSARKGAAPVPPGVLRLRLPYRPPIDADRLLRFLAVRAVPGVEEATARSYTRTITLPNARGILHMRTVSPASSASSANWLECELELEDLRDVTAAVQRCRRLLDLDADPVAISGYLGADEVLGPLARACPGRRSPGHVDGDELALRAVLGQQVSVAAARRLGARLVAEYGKPLSRPHGTLTHSFPDAATIAAANPESLPMPRPRAVALVSLATALASGEISLHPGADRDQATARLLALPGVGPWTASYIRMRALSDPDAFLPTDIGVRNGLARLGAGTQAAERWRPWRAYAVHHLWATLEQPALPPQAPATSASTSASTSTSTSTR